MTDELSMRRIMNALTTVDDNVEEIHQSLAVMLAKVSLMASPAGAIVNTLERSEHSAQNLATELVFNLSALRVHVEDAMRAAEAAMAKSRMVRARLAGR